MALDVDVRGGIDIDETALFLRADGVAPAKPENARPTPTSAAARRRRNEHGGMTADPAVTARRVEALDSIIGQ